MTQNIEKFFGFQVSLDDDLNPQEEAILKKISQDLAEIHSIDTNRYFVYFHHLRLKKTMSVKFGFSGDISDRISWLILQFEVNKKQRSDDSIRFYNSVISKDNLPEHEGKKILPSYSDYSVEFQIPSQYFSDKNYFKSAIITFIDREKIRRRERRKISATVTVIPSDFFASRISFAGNRISHTTMGVSFEKDVQLKFGFEGDELMSSNDKGQTTNIYNINQAGAVGENAVAVGFNNFQSDPAVAQLRTLLAAMSKDPVNVNDIEIVRRAAAENTREGAQEILKNVGGWVLDKAEKIGVTIAASLIKDSINI